MLYFKLSHMNINKILIIGLLVALSACSAKAAEHTKSFKVVTTFTILQDMAQNVAGDAATVVSITKPNAEIHDYKATPQDLRQAQDANLILYNGLNLERWFKRFFQGIKDVPSVVVTEGIEPLSIYKGPYTGKPNPHAWMSTSNALIYIENIRKALVAHDPANASTYNKNAKAYSAKVQAMDSTIRTSLAHIPKGQRWLVSSEGAFSYLAKDYDLKEAFLWPINADQQGTPKQVKALIDTVRTHKIPVIFSESTISSKPAQQVVKETGAHYGGVLYVDSLSAADGPVPTYLDLLRVTTSTIAQGFKAGLSATP